MVRKQGFTLIELIIVILVIAILVVVAIPQFISLVDKSRIASDDGVIGGLKSAISIQYLKNVTLGTKNAFGDYWPTNNPFELLSQSPPYKFWDSPNPDNITWQIFDSTSVYAWYIMCPHYQGDHWAGSCSKGRFYIYQYGNTDQWGHKAGDLWQLWPPNEGHY